MFENEQYQTTWVNKNHIFLTQFASIFTKKVLLSVQVQIKPSLDCSQNIWLCNKSWICLNTLSETNQIMFNLQIRSLLIQKNDIIEMMYMSKSICHFDTVGMQEAKKSSSFKYVAKMILLGIEANYVEEISFKLLCHSMSLFFTRAKMYYGHAKINPF